jgi:hypothetical protein
VQDGSGTRWTHGTVVDAGRLTHNPEVAGSNPAPATSFRRSRPFPSRERAFLRFGCCSKTCSGSRAPRGLAARRGRRRGTGSDSVDVVDVAGRDLWVRGPEVAQVHPCLSRLCCISRNARGRGGFGPWWSNSWSWYLASKILRSDRWPSSTTASQYTVAGLVWQPGRDLRSERHLRVRSSASASDNPSSPGRAILSHRESI